MTVAGAQHMTFTFKLSQRLARMRPVALILSTAALAACEQPGVSVSSPPQPGTQVVKVVVSPAAITLVPSQNQQFTASGRTEAGDSVARPVAWAVSAGTLPPTGLHAADPPLRAAAGTTPATRGAGTRPAARPLPPTPGRR